MQAYFLRIDELILYIVKRFTIKQIRGYNLK
ncbi:hypothetical protein SAMN05421788_103509 [Filimonas lacunae]|uniref:Uncharacterized protein n=1 Tax=Filimonas lacunae TaxID=477680 RepID=A0A1N7PIY8_9BACT|nr:hypothetical protein SAMN05421788_103509 [Filimonas lacunae]